MRDRLRAPHRHFRRDSKLHPRLGTQRVELRKFPRPRRDPQRISHPANTRPTASTAKREIAELTITRDIKSSCPRMARNLKAIAYSERSTSVERDRHGHTRHKRRLKIVWIPHVHPLLSYRPPLLETSQQTQQKAGFKTSYTGPRLSARVVSHMIRYCYKPIPVNSYSQ